MRNIKRYAYFNDPSCHIGPVEVIKNLFCGSMTESLTMAADPVRVDVLIPLDSLDAEIWNLGFRGEVLYCPITDFGILPSDILNDLVSKILGRLNSNKKIGLFCLGGHGRTGYVASVVLGKLGYEDPIQFLRSKYCRGAVESNIQIQHIAEVLEKPELTKRYCFQDEFEGLGRFCDFGFDSYGAYGFEADYFSAELPKSATCGDCARRIAGTCQKYKAFVEEDELACCEFAERIPGNRFKYPRDN